MSREAKLNLFLFTMLLFLSLIAWYQPGLQKTIVHYLSNIKTDDIHSIVIERRDLGRLKLTKKIISGLLNSPINYRPII